MEVPSLYFLIFELEYIIEGKKKKKKAARKSITSL